MTWFMVKHSIATGPELHGLNGAPASKVESSDARGINLARECPVQRRELGSMAVLPSLLSSVAVATVLLCRRSVVASGKAMSLSHVVVPVHSSARDGTESVTVC